MGRVGWIVAMVVFCVVGVAFGREPVFLSEEETPTPAPAEAADAGAPPPKVIVRFASGTDRVPGDAEADLRAFVEAAKARPEPIQVDGHTDDVGDEAVNAALAKRRADAVATWLVGAGIDPRRLVRKAYGEARPAEENRNSAGRAANRRVEVKLVPP